MYFMLSSQKKKKKPFENAVTKIQNQSVFNSNKTLGSPRQAPDLLEVSACQLPVAPYLAEKMPPHECPLKERLSCTNSLCPQLLPSFPAGPTQRSGSDKRGQAPLTGHVHQWLQQVPGLQARPGFRAVADEHEEEQVRLWIWSKIRPQPIIYV